MRSCSPGRSGRVGSPLRQPRSIRRRSASARSPSAMTSSESASRISSASRSGTCWLPSQRENRARRARAGERRRRRAGPRRRPAHPAAEIARIGRVRRSPVVDRPAGDPLLVEAPGQVQALEQELHRRRDDRRLLGPVGHVERAEIRGPRRRSPGTSRAHATYSRDGVRSPVSTMKPSSNASTTGSRSSSVTRRVNVAYSALVMSRSTMRSSGASSPTDSSSTLPTVEATTAPRSETRGAASDSPSRIGALEGGRLEDLHVRHRHADRHARPLADLRGAAREVGQLGDDLLHERRHDDDRRALARRRTAASPGGRSTSRASSVRG